MRVRLLFVVAPMIAAITAVTVLAGSGGAKKTPVHGVGWYASFADAKAEARRTGKPILLLSMFGRLDEEMPCANARTLRATLFKNPDFKKLVTKEVVPAWEMVRPVPHVTIDLGDGKKIMRTVRGNAVMYLCDSNGQVIDAFPGVYTAKDFLPEVRKSILNLNGKDWSDIVSYHKSLGFVPRRTEITTGKAMLESPTLDLIGAKPIDGAITRVRDADDARRRFLLGAERLRDMSLRPMTSSETYRRITGAELDRNAPGSNEKIIASDSERNMTTVRPVIHLWLASETKPVNPSVARDAVLETILKIPYKDPYFGLKDVLLPGTPD